MTLLEAIREFFVGKTEVHLQDLYAAIPAKRHSLRAQIYKNLGSRFQRVGKGVYVAIENEATCVVVERDAWDAVKEIPSRSVDAIVTDPPYPWLAKLLEIHTTTRRRMRWDFEKREIDRDLGLELYRVLKDGAHAFFFVPAETATTRPHIERFIRRLEGCGFVFNKRFVWDRLRMGMGYNGRCRHEGILFMSRGQRRKPCDLSVPDVIAVKAPDPRVRRHGTEKPVVLLERLVSFSTRAGELVLDCFAGALSTGRAALNLGRNAILIEKSAAVLDLALHGG
jgi:site-specific DNA-methyltransferase (adenine-specific)